MTKWRDQPEVCQSLHRPTLHVVEIDHRPRVVHGGVNASDVTAGRRRAGRVTGRRLRRTPPVRCAG
jgi:hypothetical protein